MRKIIFLLVFMIIFLLYTKPADAIFVVAPLLLIPIIKILALVFSGLLIPFTSAGVLLNKRYKISKWKLISLSVLLIILILMVVLVVLKLLHPDRPLV